MQAHEILLRPVITEKATAAAEKHHLVVFRVALRANKRQIREAVEGAYGVKVRCVRTLIMRGKMKRRGQSTGKRPNWKKAFVGLAAGSNIDFFATE